MIKIYPSLMAADLLNIRQDIKRVEPLSDGFHIDIMDNHFVPNITFGADIAHAIAQITTKQLWIHLMIENPENFIHKLSLPAQTIISFHVEATADAQALIAIIKSKNWLPSISIKPSTPIETISPLLASLEQVVIMSVEPGFAGQQFLSPVVEKIDPLITHRKAKNLSFRIGMDGGINGENIEMLIEKGAQDFAIGSAFFNAQNPLDWINKLKEMDKKKRQ
jgi:ribulose-phosphate 3-epimerase